MWLEGLGKLKNPLGIEHMTFRLLAQCLNQLCYHMSPNILKFLSKLLFLKKNCDFIKDLFFGGNGVGTMVHMYVPVHACVCVCV
jgi:hypothetical protein